MLFRSAARPANRRIARCRHGWRARSKQVLTANIGSQVAPDEETGPRVWCILGLTGASSHNLVLGLVAAPFKYLLLRNRGRAGAGGLWLKSFEPRTEFEEGIVYGGLRPVSTQTGPRQI